jgi:hypothetical protein
VTSRGCSHRSTLFVSVTHSSRDNHTLLLDPKRNQRKSELCLRILTGSGEVGKMVLEAGENAAADSGYISMEMSATLNGVMLQILLPKANLSREPCLVIARFAAHVLAIYTLLAHVWAVPITASLDYLIAAREWIFNSLRLFKVLIYNIV